FGEPVLLLIFEDTNGDLQKSSASITSADVAHTVTEVMINQDGDGDDSGFQSHCVDRTLDQKASLNGQLRQESDDATPSSTGSSEKSVVSGAARRDGPDIVSYPRHVAFTPAQVKRRSLITLRRNNGSPPPPASTTAIRANQKPSLLRISTSLSQEQSSSSCWKTVGGNHPVAHTVAERRARAEALEVERRRACRASLEASEAALEAARQRAYRLRVARSLELRNREEERHAKVIARRKRLEEERKEYLSRRITGTATTTKTGGQVHHLSSLQRVNPKISVCGFASDLDPTDPRYCPFGFGSSTRRDVCRSSKQQLTATRKTVSCGDRGRNQHAAIPKLSTSFTVESRKRLTTNADATFISTHAGPSKSLKDGNTTSTPSKRRNSGSIILKGSSNSGQISKAQDEPRPPQFTGSDISKNRLKIPPTPTPRSKALTLQLPKASEVPSTSSISRTMEKQRCTAAPKSPTCVRAGCKSTEVEAQTCRARLNEQRKLAQSSKCEEENNSLLETMARSTVNEAIDLAVAEHKAEVVEASAALAGTRALEKAVGLLAGLADSSAVRTERRRLHQRCLVGCSTVKPRTDGTRLLRNASFSSKEVLNNALERMTLSVNASSIRKPQSEVISALTKAAPDADQIMSRVYAPTGTQPPLRPTVNPPLRITVENNSVSRGEVDRLEPRRHLPQNGATKWMVESDQLALNSKATLILRNHLSRKKQAPPPLELCSPCTETSSISDLDPYFTNGHNGQCHGSELSLDTQLVKRSTCSPVQIDKDQYLHEIFGRHSSGTSTTIATCYSPNRQIQSDRLTSTQHSTCSDVSITSRLQH
uniref:Uncharacterized protein n=1 Tax=Echinococcus canadensis TaxID=519352 RepID=A0A915EW45_9CEST